MRSTFHGLEVAKSSLLTQQAALNTTGHNIANANTEGYSRQTVNMTAARSLEAFGMSRSNTPGQIGMGVEFDSITRIREQFLDDQFRGENKNLGDWSVRADTLSKLEGIVNEPSDSGFRTVLEKFWSSWSDLSKDPENESARKIVRETASALTDALNHTSKQLSDLSGSLTQDIDVKLSDVNSKLSMISSLNQAIQRVESLGDDANDLRDQRDLLTDQISKAINITVTDTPQGYNISMGNASLLQGTAVVPLTAAAAANAMNSGDLNAGEIHGLFVSRDQYVADYSRQLDTLANTLANGPFQVTIPAGSVLPGQTVPLAADTVMTVNGINGLHKLGYTLKDPATAGLDFFTAGSPGGVITAGNIQLNAAIAADDSLIAASMRTETTSGGTTVIKGNNTLALLMADAGNAVMTIDQTASGKGIANATLGDFYQSIVGALGVQSGEASRQTDNAQDLVDQADSRRASVSGVSLDEEMSNLIKFQHAYSAAARFMTTFDQVLDKLINGTGQVGR
ncbi:flagellar hook-associated protein FlgK [Paenibacillus humicola]|uniref:flagellar hook-associated protein FlgK n=1 Tax=Paenibacillus humicola TaxID=3110540 RepID=UPI00237BBF84|nr:flagellar hook-associated protein FlgK [Paenibacillus humicola]